MWWLVSLACLASSLPAEARSEKFITRSHTAHQPDRTIVSAGGFGRKQGHASGISDAGGGGATQAYHENGTPLTKFYVYPPKFQEDGYYSYWYGNLTLALKKSARRTENPAEAEVFFLGIDTCCELNWPSYTSWPEDANYNYGNPTKCWDTKDVCSLYIKYNTSH
jgi:hypothetical protein